MEELKLRVRTALDNLPAETVEAVRLAKAVNVLLEVAQDTGGTHALLEAVAQNLEAGLPEPQKQHVFPATFYDSFCETHSTFAVSFTPEGAQKAVKAKLEELVANEIADQVDAEDEAESWREALVEQGVPEDVAAGLTPPESLVKEAEERCRKEITDRYSLRTTSAIPVV